jgi:hypothetical protein
VLAIDWEITDDALDAFLYQVDGLLERFGTDKIIRTFLQTPEFAGQVYPRPQVQSPPGHDQADSWPSTRPLRRTVTNEDLSQEAKEKSWWKRSDSSSG